MKRLYFGLFAISLVFSTAATAATVADAIKEAEDKEANVDYDGAFAIYSDILQQFPKDFPEVWYARAQTRAMAEDNKGAVADFNQALVLDDPKKPILDHKELYHDRGEAKEFSGDPKGAIADFREAMKLDPKDSFTLSSIGGVELNLNDCAGANKDYSLSIALATTPEIIDYESRAIAHLCLGDLAGAYSDYQMAISMDMKETPPPLFGDLYLNSWAIGRLLGLKDDADKALTSALAATTPEQKTPELTREAAAYFLGQKDASAVTKAAADYTANDKDNPGDLWTANGTYYIGIKQLVDGDNAAATASFQKVIAAKHHFVNEKILAQSWMKLAKPAVAQAKPVQKKK